MRPTVHGSEGRARWAGVVLLVLGLIAAVAGPALAQQPAQSSSSDVLLPFAPPPGPSAEPKVFAHYFPPFPVSIDNKEPDVDYYAKEWLTPGGEGGIHAAYGGFLRDRPTPNAPLTGSWQAQNYTDEINAAADAGIDGFFVDVLSTSGTQWQFVNDLMAAAAAAGRGFVVAPQIDATAQAVNSTPSELAAKVNELLDYSSAYRMPTGEYVLSTFKAGGKQVSYWTEVISLLKTDYGKEISFQPILLDIANLSLFAPISDAIGDWGLRNPGSTLAEPDFAAEAHKLGVKWIQPVSVQDSRPHEFIYWEAANLAQLRASWSKAIDNGADYVFMPTWNDFSETTGFRPSEKHGSNFLDVNAYYLTRFKTGAYPPIDRDAIYLTHRMHPYAAVPPLETELMKLGQGKTPAQDQVEVMSFLTAPATLTITVGDVVHTVAAAAGVNAYSVPLGTGVVTASASRNGTEFATTSTGIPVTDTPPIQDLQYFAAGSLREPAGRQVQPPSTPGALTAQVNGTDVSLSWSAATSTAGVSLYRIERSQNGNGAPEQVGVTAGLSYVATNAPEGSWVYSVTAVDTQNVSSVPATTPVQFGDFVPPTPPGGLTATLESTNVVLQWTPGTDEAGIVGYTVERAPSGTSTWTDLGTTTQPEYTDPDVPPGSWRYRVVATDAVGNTSSSASVAVTIRDLVPPTAPGALAAAVSGYDVTLTWQPSTDAGGINKYVVLRSPSGTGSWTTVGTVTTTSFVNSAVPVGVWDYRVVAYDNAGNTCGQCSSVTATVADITPPTQPTGVNAVLTGPSVTNRVAASADAYVRSDRPKGNFGTLVQLFTRSSPQLESYLSFDLPQAPQGSKLVGATLQLRTTHAATAGSPADQRVYLADGSFDESTINYDNRPGLGAQIGSLPGGALANRPVSITLDAAALAQRLGSAQTLAIKATGQANTLAFYSSEFAAASMRPALVLTFEPESVTAVISTWTAATDNVAVTGYVVQRSTAGNGPWTDIATVPGVTYQDKNPPTGNLYYRVVAIDAGGNKSTPSPLAGPVTVP